MLNIKLALFLLVFISSMINASTMFTLSNIKKVYPVVEILGKKVPQSYKSMIYEELKTITDELQIDTNGYDQRSLAVIVSEIKLDKKVIVNIELLIGEEVKRIDGDDKIFALTYQYKGHFLFSEGDDLEDKFEDILDELLLKFSKQYKEENKEFTKVATNDKDFALDMGYETNFDEAVKKSKKSDKNIMLVLVSNFCPWCRKFEKRVLMKKEVNTIIQKNYIPLIINREKNNFPKQFDIGFTPIVHFIDYKTQKSYKNVIGYNNKDEFLYIITTDGNSTKN